MGSRKSLRGMIDIVLGGEPLELMMIASHEAVSNIR